MLTTCEAQELIADIMENVTGEGVSVADKTDLDYVMDHDKFWDYVDPSALTEDERVTVKGYVKESELDAILLELNARFGEIKSAGFIDAGELTITVGEVDDEDWFNNWKRYYDVIHVGNIAVVPEWIDYEPRDSETVVRIRPGAGFGTGEHESTRMCLMLLDGIDVTGRRVVDVGCGSGILGVAAVMKGASEAYMTDIDENAIKSANENIRLNGVADRCRAVCTDLAEGVEGHVVFANITADILIRLADTVTELVTRGGYIILSGIIKKRLSDVLEAYDRDGITVERVVDLGEWHAVLLRWI